VWRTFSIGFYNLVLKPDGADAPNGRRRADFIWALSGCCLGVVWALSGLCALEGDGFDGLSSGLRSRSQFGFFRSGLNLFHALALAPALVTIWLFQVYSKSEKI
jgi:hypothetical protein